MRFPGDNGNSSTSAIIFDLYTRDRILDHFGMTDETLPIFATLCSNDYLSLDNYPRAYDYIKRYNNSYHYSTRSINFFFYQHVANFILDMYDKAKYSIINRSNTDNGLTLLQNSIIDKICDYKPSEYSQELERNFRTELIESVKQYHLTTSIVTNSVVITGNYDPELRSNILSLSEDILNSYLSGKFYHRLLNGKYINIY